MFFLNKTEHALIAVYNDTPDKFIENCIAVSIPDKELRILTPKDPEMLYQAAQNSVLAIIGVDRHDETAGKIVRALKDNRMVSCDVLALGREMGTYDSIPLLGEGFDLFVHRGDTSGMDFKKILIQKISMGSRRLAALFLEEEYRRVCDALSAAPASMIIFDADKRAVFISDHYHRTYPGIAARLVRGLSVYDAFDMMAKEENLDPESTLFKNLQQYWYNLEGGIEFRLSSGKSYRLKSVQLPGRRGTVLMGQNITAFEDIRHVLETQTQRLQHEIETINKRMEDENAGS